MIVIRYRLCPVVLCLLCLITACPGQDDNLLFDIHFLSPEDGLSTNKVNGVAQDTNGLIWLGTSNGINIYDGHRFWRWDERNEVLPPAEIIDISSLKTGIIEIVTLEGQKFRIDPTSGEGVPVNHQPAFGYSPFFSSQFHHNFLVKTSSRQIYRRRDSNELELVYDTPAWATHSTPDGGLIVFDQQHDSTIRLYPDGRREFLRHISIGVIPAFQGQRNRSSIFYLHQVRADTPLNKLLVNFPENGNAREIPLKTNGRQLNWGDVTSQANSGIGYLMAPSGKQWIFNENQLFLFDEEGEFLRDLSPLLWEKAGDNWVASSLFIDRDDRLWLTTSEGVFVINYKSNPFQRLLFGKEMISTRAIHHLADGTLFAGGTGGGIYLIDERTGNYTFKPSQLPVSSQKLRDGSFLAGTFGDKVILITKQGIGQEYLRQASNYNQALVPLLDERDSTLYVGSSSGLYRRKRGESHSRLVKGSPEFNRQFVQYLKMTPAGLWVAGSSGLYLVDGRGVVHPKLIFKKLTFKHFHLAEDGIFWIATFGGGLLRWDPVTNDTRQYTVKDGLSDNILYAVYEDEDEHLWISSFNGLMRFDKRTYQVMIFREKDGITHNEFNTFSHHQSADGKLYFGGRNGITAFSPQRILTTASQAPLVVTDFAVHRPDSETMSVKKIGLRGESGIRLAADEKYFRLSASLLEYSGRSKVYAWKIPGVVDNWTQQATPTIQINSLPHGNHVLRIKAREEEGQWAEQELCIPLFVTPPFYLRWPFIVLITLGLLLLLYGFIRWRIHFLRLEQLRLSRLVTKRTWELTRKNEELAALNESKSRLFSLVTHDLRGPIISLGGIARKVNYLISQGRYEEVQNLGRAVDRTVNNTKELLDNLLHWALLQTKGYPHSPKIIDPKEALENAVNLYRDIAGNKNIELALFPIENTSIFCDETALTIILRNLIDNAIKFTTSGNRVIASMETTANQVSITVRDEGIGIPPKKLPLLFSDNADKRRTGTAGEKSIGIGLVLCQELAQLNQGVILVESEQGKGTSFHLHFPRVIVPATHEQASEVAIL